MDTLAFLFILALLIIGVYVLRSLTRAAKVPVMAFKRKDYLLTEAERSFYEALRKSVDEDTVVFPKVRLVDLLWLPAGTPNRQGLLNRVMSKHVDFVLCSRSQLRPVLIIELDDSSHSTDRRRTRDEVVDRILQAAGLPLLRIPAKQGYSPRELGEMIRSRRDASGPQAPVEVRRLDGSDGITR